MCGKRAAFAEKEKPLSGSSPTLRFKTQVITPITNHLNHMFKLNCFTKAAAAGILLLPLAAGAGVLNIDFNGARIGDEPGPTYKGLGAPGGGTNWNGLSADSRQADESNDDNLTVAGSNLLDDAGVVTTVHFSVGPVGGDVCCAPSVTDPADGLALLNDYIFNNSAGNSAGESDFSISGLGASEKADLYFYIRSGAVTIPGSTGERLVQDNGIYTTANTMVFKNVPVSNGAISGTIGGGTAVLWGLSIATPLPFPIAGNPSVKSVSPIGNAVRTNAQIAIELQDSDTAVNTNKIQLVLNGTTVAPTISTDSGGTTTVTYTPPSPLPESTNHIRIVFGNNSSPSVLQTNDFEFFVINDADAALVLNVDLNGLRPGDSAGATFSGQGAAGGGAVFNGLAADSTQGDDNLSVTGENLLNSIGGPTSIGFTITPVGGDNNGAGSDPLAASALLGDYVFVASAGQTSGTANFALTGLGDVPAVDLHFYYGIAPAIEIADAQPFTFPARAPFTAGNTLYFKSVPVSNGSVSGVFGEGQTALLFGLSVRKPAPGPFIKSTFPTGAGVLDDTPIRAEILDYVTKVQTNSVRLVVNGIASAPIITQPGGTNLTHVELAPSSLPEGTNRVQLIYSDNGNPSVSRTNEFTFTVVSRAKAQAVVNVDFNGSRNIPGPDVPGPTYSGQSAAGGGQVWNGIAADSRLEDGTDEDNLTVTGTDLVNSIGESTPISFTVSPMGGDVGGAPTTNPSVQGALFSDYIFNNSAANLAGESPFTLDGLGAVPFVDLYFYVTGGTISVNDAAAGGFTPGGIFTAANTRRFARVPVSDGKIEGTFGPGTTIVEGFSIAFPLPRPFVRSTAPLGAGIPGESEIVVELEDYVSQVQGNSIQLLLNGQAVSANVSKPADAAITTVRFQPSQKLPPGSTNRVSIIFSDNSAAPVVQTNEFSFVVLDEARAAKIVNIDLNGVRNVPGPDEPGSTYSGIGAAGGGFVWNGVAVDSRLEDGTDEDNLTIEANGLTNSIGEATSISFQVSPVAGDNSGGPAPDPKNGSALFNDYLFINSAANLAGEVPFTISGLGDQATVDLYFYRGGGKITITNATTAAIIPSGIFTAANTLYFKDVPVADGSVTGVFGPGTTVVAGLSIRIPVKDSGVGPLTIAHQGGTITITWDGAGRLQSTTALGGTWQDVPNASSPHPVTEAQGAQFFRLSQ